MNISMIVKLKISIIQKREKIFSWQGIVFKIFQNNYDFRALGLLAKKMYFNSHAVGMNYYLRYRYGR